MFADNISGGSEVLANSFGRMLILELSLAELLEVWEWEVSLLVHTLLLVLVREVLFLELELRLVVLLEAQAAL